MRFGRVARIALLGALWTAAAAAASPVIDPARLSEATRELASDRFQGRAPGGPAEAAVIDYLIRQFQELGLKPGGEDGGWTQRVPLVHTRVRSPARIAVTIGGERVPLA